MPGKRSVCVDFDGVLSTYDHWRGADHFGSPRPGAADFLRRLSEFARVVIFTTRCKADLGDRPPGTTADQLVVKVREWLDAHDMTYDEVYIGQGKPIASGYVDDRAVHVRTNPGHDDWGPALSHCRELCGA